MKKIISEENNYTNITSLVTEEQTIWIMFISIREASNKNYF